MLGTRQSLALDLSGLEVAAPRTGQAPGPTLHDLQYAILEAVASGTALPEVADMLCRRMEQLAAGLLCAFMLVDGDGRLRLLAAPGAANPVAAALDGCPAGPGSGTCGAAAASGHPVETHAIADDPGWAMRREVARLVGIESCWSTPVKTRDGNVAGTLAVYFRTARGPMKLERQMVASCVPLCALAIEHDRVQTRLEQTNRRFDAALSNMSQGLCFFDGSKRLVVANRRYWELYGLSAASMRPGMSLEEIVALREAAGSGPAIGGAGYLSWRTGLQSTERPHETVVELQNGRTIAVHHQPMLDGGWVATHEDITARRLAEARVVYMARHDELTGLPNRLLFQERVEHALRHSARGQQHAVLCLDLDRFKPVNDGLGRAVGDKLLQRVAKRLAGCIRDIDTVARLGSDEFAVLMVGLDRPEAAGDLAQRLVRVVGEPFELDGSIVSVGVSIGVSFSPADSSTTEALLANADIALRRAKCDERGTYRFFEAHMDARLRNRLALERDLHAALAQQQFEVFYQPLIDVQRNAVCAFEALLRWRHPVRGLVSPAEFIPVAEEAGLIVPLGAWVLQQACNEAAGWPAGIAVSVNLSPAQFKSKVLVQTVRDALAASGLAASRLELEITESLLLVNSASTLATLGELGALGVRISMDDFGTGHSSLSYLRSFPFDKIKIDQSFIRDLSVRDDSIAIVRAIVGLGKSLNMATTAEGVETQDQLCRLRTEGCTEVQGYLFSKPRPASDIPLMLGLLAGQVACVAAS